MISFSEIMRDILLERFTFSQLYNDANTESGRKDRGKHDVNPSSTLITATDDGEAWTFNYKSNPSTTEKRWHGFVQFFKEDVSQKENAMDLECMVDCDCPDYRYRYAYNNARAGVGWTGKHNGWKYNNQNSGAKWKPRSQGGVGDYGVGLCKHLCSLREYLRTVIDPVAAPEPDEKVPLPVQKKKPVKPSLPPAQAKQTTKAPTPDDSYTDSRSGSETLHEGVTGAKSALYNRIDQFVKSHPQPFEITTYEDPD